MMLLTSNLGSHPSDCMRSGSARLRSTAAEQRLHSHPLTRKEQNEKRRGELWGRKEYIVYI